MAISFSKSLVDVPMKDKNRGPNFYGGDANVWDPLITTYDMKKLIHLVQITSDIIRDHNDLFASNMVLVVVP